MNGGKMKFIFFKSICISVIFLLISCSNDSNTSNSIPLAKPHPFQITGKDEEIAINFTRIAGINTSDITKFPSYQICINDKNDFNTKTCFDKMLPPASNPLQVAFIKTNLSAIEENDERFYKHKIENGKEYYVWISCFYSDYGYSDYTVAYGKAVGKTSKIENTSVSAGENEVQISWLSDSNAFSYDVVISKSQDPEIAEKYMTVYNTNAIFTNLEKNTTYYAFVRATNNNGSSIWSNPISFQCVTFSSLPKIVENFDISKIGNKRVKLLFNVDISSAGKYEIIYYPTNDINNTKNITPAIISKNVSVDITGLNNNQEYAFKVLSINSIGSSESSILKAIPQAKISPNFSDIDFELGIAKEEFIFAEDTPHSDFWPITDRYPQGGKPATDRLVRGKETALGNLYADSINWYVKDMLNKDIDFTFLMGEVVDNGIYKNQIITPRFLMSITPIDYIDDTIVIIHLRGSDILSITDEEINLNNYPTSTPESLFGQAANVLHNGHWGGYGSSVNNGKFWGIVSNEVKYTIEYLPYSLLEFNKFYNNSLITYPISSNYPAGADIRYALPKADRDVSSTIKVGYQRGKIKLNSLTINGESINRDKIYKIATTKRIADTMYIAFTKALYYEDTKKVFWQAVGEYIYEFEEISPYLDGRIVLDGGVPTGASKFIK